jgi:hypothetical protein
LFQCQAVWEAAKSRIPMFVPATSCALRLGILSSLAPSRILDVEVMQGPDSIWLPGCQERERENVTSTFGRFWIGSSHAIHGCAADRGPFHRTRWNNMDGSSRGRQLDADACYRRLFANVAKSWLSVSLNHPQFGASPRWDTALDGFMYDAVISNCVWPYYMQTVSVLRSPLDSWLDGTPLCVADGFLEAGPCSVAQTYRDSRVSNGQAVSMTMHDAQHPLREILASFKEPEYNSQHRG